MDNRDLRDDESGGRAGALFDDLEQVAVLLVDPKGCSKGYKMTFPGLKKDEQIADLIA